MLLDVALVDLFAGVATSAQIEPGFGFEWNDPGFAEQRDPVDGANH